MDTIDNTNNTFAISDRKLLVTCTTISILSFFGILFLVVVVSIVVSQAVKLAKKVQNIKNEAKERTQDFIASEGFQDFQDNLVEATQNILGSTKRAIQKDTSKVSNMAQEEPDNMYQGDPYHY